MENFIKQYIQETIQIINNINNQEIEEVVTELKNVKNKGGRLFILGNGGSAGTASHSVNDFRKICNIETYTPTDNVSELTARINDDGVDTVFSSWLEGSRLNYKDGILVLSVGGGNAEKNVSMNLIKSMKLAKSVGATIIGIVGKDGGYTKEVASSCVIIPPLIVERITPHTEGICGVILHLLVSHPLLKENTTKWENFK